jgi:hypothetical protein
MDVERIRNESALLEPDFVDRIFANSDHNPQVLGGTRYTRVPNHFAK